MYIVLDRGFGAGPPCASMNCSATCSGIPAARFARQPPELQRVLERSFADPAGWLAKLDPQNCLALASIFNRLCRYRLWCHVVRVLEVVPGEAPLRVAGHTISVPGSTPSVYFLASSGNALFKALLETGRFCTAQGIGASQHSGQTTLREISSSDSLHISIGPGNQFDAHIDRYSPVPERPGSLLCSNEPSTAAVRHIGRELVPEKVRRKTGLPGVQLFPDSEITPTVTRPAPARRQETDSPPPAVGIRWDF